ncbi:MAG: prepilin-type N-terminal cleavage/methylation domain-containing protein [Verrucomicrobiota bacterium]
MRIPRDHRHARAFTLIEVAVSIALIAMIIGLGAMSFNSLNAERRLLEPGQKLRKYARDGLRLAMATQRAYAIELRDTYFVLREANVREEDIEDWEERMRIEARKTALDELYQQEEIAAPLERIIERYNLPPGTRVQFKRWIDDYYNDIEPEQAAEWQFDPSGICEPVSIRFMQDEGFVEMTFNPLTAKLQEERVIVDDNWESSL